MNDPCTQGAGQQPPTTATVTAFEDDYIRELGDRIASMDQDAAEKLKTYLWRTYNISYEAK